MPRGVRIALQLRPQHADYAALRATVIAAEEAGVDAITTWDHFFPLTGDPDGRHFECWTMLASWAEITSRVELGPLVACTAYRNPDLLADMTRTIDHISGGRFFLGVGSGWFERDFTEYGYDFGTAGTRLDALESALPRITARLAKLNPAPTRKIPILIGGGGERRTLRLAARHADVWHGFGDPEALAHKHAVLDGWCAVEGRDPADIERSTAADGPPDATSDQLLALGTTLFTVRAGGPRHDLGPLREWIAWRDERNGAT